MNYIRHLTGFFDRVVIDDRLNPTHISLYIAFFQVWNLNRFNNPISISRSEMMKVSKIHAKATYHKVIKELDAFGLIRYRPSYNPFKGSEVDLIELDEERVQTMNRRYANKRANNRQALNSSRTKIETSTEHVNEPYINNTNTLNSKQAYEQSNKNSSSVSGRAIDEEKAAGKNSGTGRARPAFSVPASVEEVKEFFEEEKSTKLEAEKFYNYFQSNGWRVGGRSPMKDWRAAARNWMLNANAFKPKQKTSTLHVSTEKDYGEPL